MRRQSSYHAPPCQVPSPPPPRPSPEDEDHATSPGTARPRQWPPPALMPTSGLCKRCAGVGTHYLTCPGLRLPAGYDFRSDSAGCEPALPLCLCGLAVGSCSVCA